MADGNDVQPAAMQTHESFSTFIQTHHGLMIGGGVVLTLVLAGAYMSSKNKTLPATSQVGDLSGLTNGVVYVPTSTSFSTTNQRYGAQSNDPNLTTITNSPVNSNNPVTTTKTTTTTNNPAPVPPIPSGGHQPPPPIPPPPTKGKGLIWDSRYTISGGETLSSISARITTRLRAQGMPGSMSISWHDLYGHNTDLINRTAQSHGYRTDYWNWIFPNEVITVPRWG